ncbi:MAG: PEP-CTERM sorting domain-containing protein [Sphingobium sp.]|nr:PEP-CTERM sorting domain-containing protein [Sphingobium sp.]
MRKTLIAASLAATILSCQPASAGILKDHWSVITSFGAFGVLRAGSPWANNPQPSVVTLIDEAYRPENELWNSNSIWWDQDPSVNENQPWITIDLDASYSFNRFKVQADDNDSYLLEYWDGAAWQTAFNVGAVYTYGLVTRDSGIIGTITTNKLRFTATGGDNYYAVSEIEGFAPEVPEPASWALMIAGFAAIGAGLRRNRQLAVSFG